MFCRYKEQAQPRVGDKGFAPEWSSACRRIAVSSILVASVPSHNLEACNFTIPSHDAIE
jgi:hypothetical protein